MALAGGTELSAGAKPGDSRLGAVRVSAVLDEEALEALGCLLEEEDFCTGYFSEGSLVPRVLGERSRTARALDACTLLGGLYGGALGGVLGAEPGRTLSRWYWSRG